MKTSTTIAVNQKKIRSLSIIVDRILIMVLILLPVLDTVLWFYAVSHEDTMMVRSFDFPAQLPISSLGSYLGWAVNCIPLVVILLGVWWLRKLFKNYAKGEIFTIQNVRYYRFIAYCFLIYFFVLPLHEVLLTLILSIGHETVNIGISLTDTNLLALLVGIVLTVISHVMEAGHILEEEQKLTV
jgi:Protein of unknown function (DUF2975)